MLYGYRDRKIAAPAAEPPPAPWDARLPASWRSQVRAPRRFEVFREPELAAERCFGYDAKQVACYYAHSYCIDELRSDDDEEFYLCTPVRRDADRLAARRRPLADPPHRAHRRARRGPGLLQLQPEHAALKRAPWSALRQGFVWLVVYKTGPQRAPRRRSAAREPHRINGLSSRQPPDRGLVRRLLL